MVSNRCPLFPLGLLLALAVVVSGLGCPQATPPNPPNQGGMKVVPLDDAAPVNAGPVNAGPPVQGVPPDPGAQAGPGPRTPDGSKGAGAADADPTPPRPAPSGGGKRYALLVAVQQYDSPDLDDLSFTEADAEDLAKVLRDGGYRPENVVLMTKSRGDKDPSVLPTAERIRAELSELMKRCGPDDLVLVGLTGHGIQPKNGKQLFCGYKAKLDDAKTLLPIDEVYQTIGTSAAGMKLLLVDACRNDPGGKGRDRPVRGDGDYASVTSGTPPTGVIALYSCSEGERSWEPAELKHGLFFHFLIEGLKGKADLYNDGKITWPGVVGYLDRSVNSYAETRLRKRQRPHFKGDTNVQIPLVVWPRESVPADKATANAPPLNPLDLVNEDFRKAGGLPAGWKGNFFSVEKDKSGRRCLESTAKEGVHYLSLPEMDLRGDFFVECEFLLDGYPEYQKEDQHRLIVELETPDGTRIPIVVDHEGIVTIKNGQPRAAAEYKPFQITRFRLVREKNTYRVSLNDADARGTPLEYAGDFKTVWFGLVAGVPVYNTLKTTSKIYSIHVGRLTPDKDTAMGPAKDEVTMLLNEDFSQASLGGPPKGWDGTAFSVEKDKNGRRCLEVVAKEGPHFVQLPRLGLHGDFFVECEVLLDGYRDYEKEDQHRLLLELESRDGNRLPVVVSHEGDVTIHRDGQPRRPPNFKPFQVTRVRLVREGTVYRVSLGDDDPTGRTLNYTGDFETIRLGLVAGVPVYHTLNTTSKIYSVKVGLLKGAATPAGMAPAAAGGIREEFRQAKVGGLPDGWSLSPAALLTVQKSGERPGLEINGMGPGTDAVTLPAVSLKGDFFLDCEFEIASKDALVIVQLEGGPRNVVLLQVKGDGKMSMQNRFPGDAGKAWNAAPKTNLLRLERKGGAYRVKINDQDVGSLPDTVAPGELTAVKLGMSLKNKDDKTPRIYSVRVVPLDEPAKP